MQKQELWQRLQETPTTALRTCAFSLKCYTENNGKKRHLGMLKKTCIPCENSVAEGWTLFQSTHSDLLIVTQERASESPRGDGLSQRLIPQCQGPTVNRCRVQDSRPPLPRPSPVLSPVPTTFPGKGRGSAWTVPTRGREIPVLGMACRPAQPPHYEIPSELFQSWLCLLIYIVV